MSAKALLDNSFWSFFRNRELILEMTKRDLKVLNKGAALGTLWILISPFVQTLTYVFIVTLVFSETLNTGANRLEYALFVLSGMIPWQIIARTTVVAPSLIRDRIDLVKQVIYPIETLPITALVTNSIGSLVALVVFFVLAAPSQKLGLSILLFPLPLILISMFLVGLSWILGIVGILLKDLREIISLVFGVLIYISPVIVTPELVGERVWNIVLLNPLSHMIIVFRDVLFGTFHEQSWWIVGVLAVGTYALGAIVFTQSKLMIREYI